MTIETRAVTSLATLTTSDVYRGLQTVRSVLAPDLSDDELRLFAMVATRSGLDPWARQIYAIKRKGRVTFQTSIDGYRSIAARTGLYDGQDEPEYGPWIDKPYGHPEWATVRVHRKGVAHPIAATAFWDEYVQDAGPSGNGDLMWRKMPRVMIAKVAEALALRKAFPYDPENRQGIGADIYTADEMAQAERPAPERPPQRTLAEKAAEKRAEIERPAVEEGDPGPMPPAPAPPGATETAAGGVTAAATHASSPDASTPADGARGLSTGLSFDAFSAAVREAGATEQHVIDATRYRFPEAKRLSALTDEQRGLLFADIEDALAGDREAVLT